MATPNIHKTFSRVPAAVGDSLEIAELDFPVFSGDTDAPWLVQALVAADVLKQGETL